MASARQAAKELEPESVLRSLKSAISNAKHQFSIHRTQGKTGVTKPMIASKPRLSERELLRKVMEDLAIKKPHNDPDNLNQISDDKVQHVVPADSSRYTRMQPARTDLRISHFEIAKPLGRGKFGQVYLTRHRPSDFICALKVVSKAQCTTEAEEKQSVVNSSIYLVLEYAPNGDLYSRLTRQPKGYLKERDAALYVTQMAEALRYMHDKNVMHRDIKPENILLGFCDEIKLADFGWSVHSESEFRSTVCGTLDYLAPEMPRMISKPGQTDQQYTNAIELWSLGVLTYELLVGKPPIQTKNVKGTEKIANLEGKVKFPTHVSKDTRAFVIELMHVDANERISLEEVLDHRWIKCNVDQTKGGG